MGVPVCHARQIIEGRGDLFYCRHPRMFAPRQLVEPELCLVCTLAATSDTETLRPACRFPVISPDTPCRHLGAYLRLDDCKTCQGRVRLKVFACAHPEHGETTLNACRSCIDFEPNFAVPNETVTTG